MKGTLFSADFVKDSSGKLRLLELNTDTAILDQELDKIDYYGFFNILESNNITELAIIYKPFFHKNIVNSLSKRITENLPSVNKITLYDEDVNSIYPTIPNDTDNMFILRIAYDESAIFDSYYAKDRLNVYKLFTDNNINDYTAGFYYSDSNTTINTITNEINPDNIPDVSIKDSSELFNPIDFYKIGSEGHHETDEQRWNGFLKKINTENKIVEQYHFHPSNIGEDNKLNSVRYFGIVYGSSLEYINIHSYQINSMFDLPTSLDDEVDLSKYDNKIKDHHYFEYTTNFIKPDSAGVLSTERILMEDNTWKSLEDINVGENITSYYISDTPVTSGNLENTDWYYEGGKFPSGSYVTSSRVVYKGKSNLKYGGLIELKVDGDSIFSGIKKQYLIYDSSSNKTTYKHSTNINPETDYFYDLDSNLIDIDEVNFYITTETDSLFIELDVEETDTYIISGSTSFNSVVSHNAPCFVAGTKITTDNGIVNIENIKIGDNVLTFNHQTEKSEFSRVSSLISRDKQPTVEIFFDNGEKLHCTHDHPIFSAEHGYVSYDKYLSKKKYGMDVGEMKTGLHILLSNGGSSKITKIILGKNETVYNLKDIQPNHNYYANDFLVHNRCFKGSSLVEMFDGTRLPIDKVKTGDEVKSILNGEIVKGIVTDVLVHPVNNVVEVTKYKSMVSDRKHPLFQNNEWVSIDELKNSELSLEYIDNFYNLEIDGNDIHGSEHCFIIEGNIVSGLGDNEKLNNVFKRQVEFK